MNATYFQGDIGIRPFPIEDAPAAFAAVEETREDLQAWLPAAGVVRQEADVAGWIATHPEAWEQGESYQFAIVNSAGEFLGGCGLTAARHHHRFANAYYWVRQSAQGRGVAASALQLLARFGLEGVGLERIEIVVAIGNAPSLGVARKSGAVEEGVLRRRILIDGVAHDAVMFSMIRADLG